VLGGGEADGVGAPLDARGAALDRALGALYEGSREGGLGDSAPNVARWLGDVRELFPQGVVRVLQHDAIERLGFRQLLAEPELLDALQPDVNLAADLLSLAKLLPAKARESARRVVRQVVDDVERRLESPLRQAVTGSLDRAVRTRRPRTADIDWGRTVLHNLRHYQPDLGTVVPERLVGYGRRQRALRDVIVCADQSGSMAASVVYAGICACVLASLRAVETRLVVFDTNVADLSEHLDDPVETLFGTNLGGGTDINAAVAYCQDLISTPADTIFVLISDLYEGGIAGELVRRMNAMKLAGVQAKTGAPSAATLAASSWS
jgi:Mg-chelatase subunit ChlD